MTDPTPVTEIVLTRIIQTCRACPSQWDAWDADGQYYYLRYRFGHGTIDTARAPNDLHDAETIAQFNYGGAYDGDIGIAEFLAQTQVRMELATP
jgi:hypothetical protein